VAGEQVWRAAIYYPGAAGARRSPGGLSCAPVEWLSQGD